MRTISSTSATSWRAGDRVEQLSRCDVVAGVGRELLEPYLPAGSDHERRTELRRVADRLALAGAADDRLDAADRHLGAEQSADPGHLRPDRLVALTALVGQQRQLDPELAAEVRRVARLGLPDQDQIGAGGLELLASVLQLQGVLTAVDSAVVAQPHQRDRALPPQLAEPRRLAVVVRQRDLSQLRDHSPKV